MSSSGFSRFSELPPELQLQITEHAAVPDKHIAIRYRSLGPIYGLFMSEAEVDVYSSFILLVAGHRAYPTRLSLMGVSVTSREVAREHGGRILRPSSLNTFVSGA